METILTATAIVAAVALAGSMGLYFVWCVRHGRMQRPTDPPTSWLHAAERTRILVQTDDRQTIEGSLVRVDTDGIYLEPARYADHDHDLRGGVWIPRERIAWIQRP